MSTPIAPAYTIDPPPASDAPGESELLGDQRISEEDRREILESIERVASQNRISAGDSLKRFTALKKGLLFPLVINIAAVIVVAAGFVGSNIYFSRKQAAISSRAGTFFSAEGLIVAQLKKQSEEKLAAKDQEIATVKAKLAKLNQESAALRTSMQSRITAKETQLEQTMQSQLAGEKARLEKLGISQSQVTSRMKAFEQQKTSELARQMDQFKKQNEAALLAKERQIKAQQAQSRQALSKANQERSQLVKQSQQQQAALRARYQAQTKRLQSANERLTARTTAAEKKLAAVASRAQSEQLVTDEIVGSYRVILSDIQQARYSQADTTIASLKALLQSPKIDSLPLVSARRSVDLQILTSLEQLAKRRSQSGAPPIDPALVHKADEVTAAEKLVTDAQTAQKKGDARGASSLYTRAIAQIPVIEQAYTALKSIFDRNQTALLSQRDGTIASLKNESNARSAAIARLTKRLSDSQAALRSAQSEAAALRTEVAGQSTTIARLTHELSANAAASADLKQQLSKANASIAALESRVSGGNSQSSGLEKQLADARKAEATYRQRLAEQTASAAQYKKDLGAANARAASLEQKLAANESRVGTLKTGLSAAQAKVQALQTSSLPAEKATASLQNRYAALKTELTPLIANGSPADVRKAQTLLLEFVNRSGVDSLLPGFSAMAGQVATTSSKVAEEKARKAGRDTALRDVISVTNYFNAPANSPEALAARAQIEQQTANDPLYRQAANDIQQLAEKSGKAAGHASLPVRYHLVGTISYISSDGIIVEKLVSTPVKRGETVLIQHRTAHRGIVPIADGTVTGSTRDSVDVKVRSLLAGSTAPALLDLVYLEPAGGT